MATKKKSNFFKRYFVPFGLNQLCGLLMFCAAILLIIGLCLYKTAPVLILIGFIIFGLCAIMMIFKMVKVLLGGLNKRSPEYKSAVVNLVLMCLILAISVFGVIWYFI